MIFGNCPYCDHNFNVSLVDGLRMQKQECEQCKKTFWTLHSRLDPKSWTDDEFNKIFLLDEETKNITLRDEYKDKSIYEL